MHSGYVDRFMEQMRAIIAGVPYNTLPQDRLKLREQNYQTAVYLIFKLMGQFTQTEVVSSRGRADAVVHTPDTIYVFEFKLMGSGTPQDAVKQIREKGYAEPYRMSGKKIVLIGAVFNDEITPHYDGDYAEYWMLEELMIKD